MNEIMRTNPFNEIMSLQDAMNQLFTESFVSRRLLGQTEQVPLDLYETDNEYVAKLTLPGLKPEDVEITMQDNMLRVHGETRAENKEQAEEGRYHVREQRFGAFDRVIRFPGAVNGEKVDARLSEGILTLRVPKSEEARAKRITVNAS